MRKAFDHEKRPETIGISIPDGLRPISQAVVKPQKFISVPYHVTLIPIDTLALELRGIHSLLVLPRMWSIPMKKL